MKVGDRVRFSDRYIELNKRYYPGFKNVLPNTGTIISIQGEIVVQWDDRDVPGTHPRFFLVIADDQPLPAPMERTK